MKKKSYTSWILCGLLAFYATGIVAGCAKSTGPSGISPNAYSITAILKTGTNTTLISHALAKTGLDSVFSQPGPYTFFVVTDNVLTAAGINDSVISAYNDSALRYLILYHTLAGQAILSANFPKGPNAKTIMANGDSVFATYNGTALYVNGIKITAPDIIASNGLLDVIAQVLFPPKGSLLQTFQTDSNFNMLNAALMRASQGSTNIDSILSGPGSFTFFAPVNAAFASAGYSSVNDINNANPDSLAGLLLYHILGRRYFTSDMVVGDTPLALNDSSFTIIGPAYNSWQIQGKMNTGPTNILNQNRMATNGVIQSIDQIMRP
jgi:uncharacterized surface protein with fasciclin (FAS1) repeats